MDNLLDFWEKENNDKNGKQYHAQWIFPSILLLSVWHSQEGGSSLTLKFESTHGRKTRGTHFTRTEMDQRPDLNHSCKILLLNDPQILPSQYHAGSGAGLVFGIGPWIAAINCVLEKFHTHTPTKIIVQHATKKENITPNVSPTTVFPLKREKGGIYRRPENIHTDVYMYVLILTKIQKPESKYLDKATATGTAITSPSNKERQTKKIVKLWVPPASHLNLLTLENTQ